MTDAPSLAWFQPEPDSDDTSTQFVVLGLRIGGNDGERVAQQVMAYAHQVGEETFAILPMDLACEVTRTDDTVTVHLTAPREHLATLAQTSEEWRQRVARLLPDGTAQERVTLLTATLPEPEGLEKLAPTVIAIDFEHGDTPEDLLAAVSDGETAYTLVSPDTEPDA